MSRWSKPDPCDEYLEALARRALSIYRETVATNPMQAFIWQSGNFDVFIEAAAVWPWDTRARINRLVNSILIQVVLKQRELPEAVAAAKRVAKRPLNTGLD